MDASVICTLSERAGIDLQIKNLVPKRTCRVCLSAPIQKLAREMLLPLRDVARALDA